MVLPTRVSCILSCFDHNAVLNDEQNASDDEDLVGVHLFLLDFSVNNCVAHRINKFAILDWVSECI